MIKGCQKKMIHLRPSGSEMFEEAYFILREDCSAAYVSESDMVREANRVINKNLLSLHIEKQYTPADAQAGEAVRPRKKALMFVFGMSAGSILTLCLRAVISLFG